MRLPLCSTLLAPRMFAQALLLPALILPTALHAQAKATDDTLIFTSGEQLVGTLESADSGGIVFNSKMAGEIKVKWANIKELHSDKNFAVLTKKEKLTRHGAAGIVPQGTVKVEDKNIEVGTSSGSKTVPLADANLLLDAAAFDKAINHPPTLLQGWGGSASAGASLVRANQNTTSFNGAINLVRTNPVVTWLPPRDRTNVDYTQSYSTVTQPLTSTTAFSTVSTNIFHADAEHDEYFTPRLFAFGSVTFDHNYSQLLALQSAYGGGIGITVLKTPRQSLDFKGDAHYEKQEFITVQPAPPAAQVAFTPSVNLFGSTFSETYVANVYKGIVLNEFGSVSPSWTQSNAFSSHVNANLVFPIYKGLGFNVGAVDDYLNNAPVGSKQNSTQFTTGLTYTIKPRY